jgi:hypothetical protein
VELRACPNVRGEGRVAAIFTRDPDEVEAFVRAWAGKPYGIYFGCGTRTRKRGTAEDVGEIPALWLDNDTTPKDELRAALLSCPYPPTFIIDSGRGLHAYWLLDESTAPAPDVVDLLKGLRRVFAGDPAVCDLARIMRLPGTENSKYGDPLPVTVIHSSDLRHQLADLRDWLSWQRELVGEPENPFLAAAERLGIRPSVDLGQMLADMSHGTIHDTQLRVSASLAASGRSEPEIFNILMEATRLAANGTGVRKKRTSGI